MNMYSIDFKIKQDPWNKKQFDLDDIKQLKILHCPHGHTKNEVKLYKSNPTQYKTKYTKRFVHDIEIDDIICVSQAKYNKALLVKIKSDCKTGTIPSINVIEKNNNIECVITDKKWLQNNSKMLNYMKKQFIVTPFTTIYRDIEIIKEVNLDDIRNKQFKKYTGFSGSTHKSKKSFIIY
jgi:hypothetical protein